MLFDYVKAVYRGDSPSATPFYALARRITSLEARATSYWESRLKGARSWSFPRNVSSTTDAWRASKVVNVPKEATDRFCRRYGVSAQSIAQAAWAKVLAIRSVHLDVVYGHVVSGRMIAESEKVIGPMFVSASFFWGQSIPLNESRTQFLVGLLLVSVKRAGIWCDPYTNTT